MDELYWVHTACGEAFHADTITSLELLHHMASCPSTGGKFDTNWELQTESEAM